MSGTLADPVRLDPWQNIVSVGWASGVHLDGTSWLTRPTLLDGVADAAAVTGRFRVRFADYSGMDPGGIGNAFFAFADAVQPVFAISLAGPGSPDGSIAFDLRESPGAGAFVGYRSAPAALRPGAWRIVTFSFDTGHAAGARLARLLVDGVPAPINVEIDVGGPFAINFADPTLDSINLGTQWALATPGAIGDVSLFELWPGAWVDLDVAADRDLHTLGDPAIRLSGGPGSFADNRGTGGAFSVVGVLGNPG